MPNAAKIVDISRMRFAYRGGPVLFDSLNFSLRSGALCGLLGKNGSGKTTLLKLLSGLLAPREGAIEALGHKPQTRSAAFLQNIFFVPEETVLPDVSAALYAKLTAPFYPRFSHQLFEELLQELEIPPGARMGRMSFGTRKKAALAFAFACRAPLLVLDEPTNGLDIPSKAKLRLLAAKAWQEEGAVLISTHQAHDLDGLINDVCIIGRGRALLHAPLEKLASRLAVQVTAEKPEHALFTQQSPLGYASLAARPAAGSSGPLDLELLFNAVDQNAAAVAAAVQEEPLHG